MFYIGRNMGYDKRLSEGCKIVLTIFYGGKEKVCLSASIHVFKIYTKLLWLSADITSKKWSSIIFQGG